MWSANHHLIHWLDMARSSYLQAPLKVQNSSLTTHRRRFAASQVFNSAPTGSPSLGRGTR